MNKKLLILLILSVYSVQNTYAQLRRKVPAIPHPIEFVQPNGDTLMIRLHGDERKHWNTTLDGYLIMKDEKGRMCYAYYNKKGELIVGSRVAHNEDKRSKCEKNYLEKNIPNRLKEE